MPEPLDLDALRNSYLQRCSTCDGDGSYGTEDCQSCDGEGFVSVMSATEAALIAEVERLRRKAEQDRQNVDTVLKEAGLTDPVYSLCVMALGWRDEAERLRVLITEGDRQGEEMPIKTYVVQVPFRGVKTLLVRARTAREAKRKVDDGPSAEGWNDVEGLDSEVCWSGKANYAREDKPGEGRH